MSMEDKLCPNCQTILVKRFCIIYTNGGADREFCEERFCDSCGGVIEKIKIELAET